jgi:inosose dehydratase
MPRLAPVTSATLPEMSATWDSVSRSRLGRGYCDHVSALRLANAPVSFGAFELTANGGFAVPDPEQVLAAIADAGYEGTELGPPGYLGGPDVLGPRLESHGLELVAGFVPVHFADPDRTGPDLERQLLPVLDLFEAAGASRARPLLADAGPRENDAPLDAKAFALLAQGVERGAELSRSRGFEPAFHHHGGSYVQEPREIEALLEATDVNLVLDTGHLLLGGGDPARAVQDWAGRIDHVHVKDARLDVLRESASMSERWRRGAFCELGSGDVDLDAFFAALTASGYSGWLVVEQDRVLEQGASIADAAAAQQRNRRWLEQHLEPLRA